MTLISRLLDRLCRCSLAALVVASSVVPATGLAQTPAAGTGSRPASAPPSNVNPQTAAMVDFQQRLDAYLQLRTDLSKKLKPLDSTADAGELATRQEALAKALQQHRKMAKQGDLVPAPVAEMIRATVTNDFRKRAADVRQALFAEIPKGRTPTINRFYPSDDAMPTVPPLILNELPPLPDNLQYRFFDRHVVILDGDTQIIIDYVVNVLPTR